MTKTLTQIIEELEALKLRKSAGEDTFTPALELLCDIGEVIIADRKEMKKLKEEIEHERHNRLLHDDGSIGTDVKGEGDR